jgi:hypothetical protein
MEWIVGIRFPAGKKLPHVPEAHLGSCLLIQRGYFPELKTAEA